MVNDLYRNKNIDSIRKQLHAAASQPPREDPFSRNGREAWENWVEICRGYESELVEAGVNL
jgi:hypothetical protein